MVLTGEPGAQNWCLLGDWGGLLWAGVGRVLLAPRRSRGLHCSGMLLPMARAKRDEAPQPLPPRALAPGGGHWGSPRWQQGREDRIWAGGCSLLLPTLVMLLPAREGTLCRAPGGCTHQANSPNSPSRGRTQPVQLPCMYRYLHMYTHVLRAGSCPALRTHQHAQGWGQGAIPLCQPLTNTHIWHKTHTPPTALSLCRSARAGAGWDTGGSGEPLGLLHLRRAGEGQAASLSQAGLQPLPAPSRRCAGPGCARCQPAVLAGEGGREALSLQPQHPSPVPPLWPLLWLIHGWRILSGAGSGGEGWGDKGL